MRQWPWAAGSVQFSIVMVFQGCFGCTLLGIISFFLRSLIILKVQHHSASVADFPSQHAPVLAVDIERCGASVQVCATSTQCALCTVAHCG